MSALPASSYNPALTSSSLPPIDRSRMPAEIRNGDDKAKQAYQEALGFEDVLVQQLTQELASTVTSPSGTGADGSTGASGDSSQGGILGADPSTNAFASLIPNALTSNIMSGGGVGIAVQLARAIDPAIGTPQGSATPASTPKSKS